MKKIGLYIHVPFCESKCPYCNFYSVVNSEEPQKVNIYTDKVLELIKFWKNKLDVTADTLYFGGGTPNLLGDENIIKITALARGLFNLSENAEISMEINPTNNPKLYDFTSLKQVGINRLSLGMQSANNNELELLGRRHLAEDTINTIKEAQKKGFENISVDLMICTPEQTKQDVLNSIKICKDLGVQHVSVYTLKIEKGTPYYKNRKKIKFPDENESCGLYLYACEQLENLGFYQYEISNFAKKGYESKHNLKYWNSDEYLGIGPSAHSFLYGKRFFYNANLEQFLNNGQRTLEDEPNSEIISGGEEEYSMLRLRLTEGLTNYEYKKRFGNNIPEKYFNNASKISKEYINITNNSISFTKKGFLVSNELISKIIF